MSGSPQLILDLASRPALGRAEFFVSPANAVALGQIDEWPGWPGPALVVLGPEGAGKTHLAHVWAARSGAEILDAAALAALDPGAVPDGAARVVEDVDRLGGPAETALFHLYNRLAATGGSLMATARRAPAKAVRLPDLASRLGAAPVARLEPPDDALLAAVLVKLFADRGVAVGPDLVRYLVPRMERSLAATQALVARIDARALAEGRAPGLRLAAEMLGEG